MTFPFGRRRLIVTLSPAPTAARRRAPELLLGGDDHDLARLSRTQPGDIERARWEGMSLIYGGVRRA